MLKGALKDGLLEDFVSPYIKGKTVIDWGCGPGQITTTNTVGC